MINEISSQLQYLKKIASVFDSKFDTVLRHLCVNVCILFQNLSWQNIKFYALYTHMN